tara:strand:- start:2584 stop:2790 length:207 start_codon:yes stop_codon:yes gene_type:complete
MYKVLAEKYPELPSDEIFFLVHSTLVENPGMLSDRVAYVKAKALTLTNALESAIAQANALLAPTRAYE